MTGVANLDNAIDNSLFRLTVQANHETAKVRKHEQSMSISSYFRTFVLPHCCPVFGASLAATMIVPVCAADVPKRAKPPTWSKDVLDIFFPDAREALVGLRPHFAELAEPAVASSLPAVNPDAAGNKSGWSQWIAPDVLEAEIKRQAPKLEKQVASASTFKGGAYEDTRDIFSLLAVLFAISAEHDEDARWKDSAAGLRDLFGRAGLNSKIGTDQTYREALARAVDLAELIRGGRPDAPAGAADASWTTVADRPPLMRRIELAHEERLSKWLANENLFKRNAEEISHEAQILSALAEIIKREGYEFADDDTFVGYANELRDAAHQLRQATDQEDYVQARAALGRATKACSRCHEGYRG